MLTFLQCFSVNIKQERAFGMEVNIVLEAIKFLILGISTVCMVLMLIIFALKFQAKIVMKLFPYKQEKFFVNSSSAQQLSSQDNLAFIAAIAVSLKFQKNKNH